MAKKFLTGVDLQGQRAQNVAAGTAPSDAVNLAQVQSLLAGLSWHGSVRAASTGNVSLTSPGANLDGVALNAGDRILLKNQTTASQNGPYIWNGSSSALTLASDGQQGAIAEGAAFYVAEGTTNTDTAWVVNTSGAITVGTTSISFVQFGASIAYTAGAGLKLTGTQFAADYSLLARHYAANVGDGSSTSYTVAHNFGTLDVLIQLVLVSTGETVEADITRPTTNTVAIGFATAPASGAYRIVIVG